MHIYFPAPLLLLGSAAKTIEMVESSDNESMQSGDEEKNWEEESRGDSNPVESSQQPQVS